MSLLSYEQALQRVLEAAEPLGPQRVPVQSASGRVLAQPLHARWDLPGANVSVMDGYAARSEDLAAATGHLVLRRVGESAAGHPSARALEPGQAARISTGAVLPDGADLVVPQEDVEANQTQVRVDLEAFGDVRSGRWVRAAGSDVKAGEVVVPGGVLMGAGDLAAAASIGHATVLVHRRPVVGLVSSGDELVAIGHKPGHGQVVGSNGMMLAAQVQSAGAVAHEHGFVIDQPGPLRAALRSAAQLADVLVTTGGASVGDHDLVIETLKALGTSFSFHGVALRPGKPAAYGRLGDTHVFCLPGNPASTLATFELLVRPALRKLLGVRGDPGPTKIDVRLTHAARGAGNRAHFVRARLHRDGTATVLDTQTSGSLRSIVDFDALVEVPPSRGEIPAGEVAQAVVVEPWWTERRSS